MPHYCLVTPAGLVSEVVVADPAAIKLLGPGWIRSVEPGTRISNYELISSNGVGHLIRCNNTIYAELVKMAGIVETQLDYSKISPSQLEYSVVITPAALTWLQLRYGVE